MKNMFNSSTIMGGSIDFSAPTITKTDCFVSTITTMPGVSTYQTTRP